ncbi:MAG TPA: peptide-methionine (S)-S-oxide reductase MsrA [Thermoanaerobaculia bacterium]|jgi:peptide-methionine (S)-S-oxide reductase|nr:peptide-methionine (S)-S-oxide reductase MsrA [Thermoanaerobaculia bacterium]
MIRKSLLQTVLVAIIAFAPQTGMSAPLAKATFAGGCFWCMVHPFDQLKGVTKVTSGYAGGRTKNPTYEEVSAGGTGHRESVEVIYDPKQIAYAKLLDVFWHNIDPTNNNGQFCDHGDQYRSAIFYHDAEQKRLAEASKAALQKRMKVYTDILPAGDFYAAEEYHQDYYKKNPVRYRFYRLNCGRDYVLNKLWGNAAGH